MFPVISDVLTPSQAFAEAMERNWPVIAVIAVAVIVAVVLIVKLSKKKK